MGLSSSQARLLHLTNRMHQIEYKAQKLEAQKLQLANESDRVYGEYLEALDATKVQYRALNPDGTATFIDATLARLENGAVPDYTGEVSSHSYLIKNPYNNEIYVTREFADAYGITDGVAYDDPGTLDQYLDAKGANKTEVMERVPNYNDIQSVNPVKNVQTKDSSNPLVTDPDTFTCNVGNLTTPSEVNSYQSTTYGYSGSYVPAEGNIGSVSYSVNNNIPNTMSVSPYYEMDNMINVVTDGTNASASTKSVTSSSVEDIKESVLEIDTSAIKYKKLNNETMVFDTSTINTKLSVLFASLMLDYSDSGVLYDGVQANTIDFHYMGEANGINNYLQGKLYASEFTYTENTTLNDLFTWAQATYPGVVTWDSSTGTLRSNGYVFNFYSHDDARFDHKISNEINSHIGITWEPTEYDFSKDTAMFDYLFSDKSYQYSVFAEFVQDSLYVRDISTDNYLSTTYDGSEPLTTVTFDQYLTYLQDNKLSAYGFNYQVDESGKIKLTIDGNYDISFLRIPGTKSKIKDITQTNNVTLNTKAIAENIYLGRAILAGTEQADYDAARKAGVSSIETILQSKDKRTIAILNDELNEALNANDNHVKLTSVMAKIESFMTGSTYTPNAENTDSYLDSTITDNLGNRTITNYNIVFTSSNVSFTPSVNEVSDGTTTINKGEIKNAPSDEDMKEFLAKAMYDSNNGQSYESYLTKLNGYGLNSYELAILYNNKSNSGMLSALINSTSKSNVISWINNNLDARYNDSKLNSTYYTLVNQSSSNQYTCTNNTIPSTATSPSRTDIINYIAYQMYTQYPEKTPFEWASYISNKFNSSNWNYSDENVASISSNFESNSSNILSKLYSNQNLDAYINSFNGYSVTMDPDNHYSLTTATSGTEEHYVNMDSKSDIATRIASDIYALDNTVNPNTIRDQIIEKLSTQQLASLSTYYGTSTWSSIVSALASNINPSSVSSWTGNLKGYTNPDTGVYMNYTDYREGSTDFSITTNHNSHNEFIKGEVNIPTIEGIASNLVVAFRQVGKTVDPAEVENKLRSIYVTDNQTNNEILAKINDVVCGYLENSGGATAIENIYNHLYSGSTLSILSTYSSSDYLFIRKNLGNCQVQYGTTEKGTGKYDWVYDDYYNQLVVEWNAKKQLVGNIYKIIDEPLASSYEYVRNLICESGAYLLEFNNNLSDMKDTSVAVETNLREVADEKNLKKAEAKYEADMRRIDKKDRKYDTDLAALETERSATKEEIETLKTVAKDNVDRTFKLFS